MGISFSCPFALSNDVENAIDSVVIKSISFGDDKVKTPVRTVSFGGHDMEAKIVESMGSGDTKVERSVSLKGSELEKMISFKGTSFDKDKDNGGYGSLEIQKLPIFDPSNPKHQAAIKLQKVYKSFRTRRKLADCAVLVEQSWWKLLDFAELKRSSISFFDIEKHETAISRWSRARTRAAKVGKGLSKNDKAQKLALQHWLEAIDPRHRYGHNLHFYYGKWLHSKSREPFFYWLDIGEGREVNLIEKCPRSKLQQQCIKYLGPMERKAYEVVVEEGKFVYKQSGEVLHTTEDAKWIFVLSTSKTLYVGKKKKGTFQHSSFLAGGVAMAAGRLVAERGILKAVWPHSGHYRPTEENFQDFLSFLRENNVDLTDVKTSPEDEEDSFSSKLRSSKHLRSISSDEDFLPVMNDLENEEGNIEELIQESNVSVEDETSVVVEHQKSRQQHNYVTELTDIEIPKRDELLEELLRSENPATGSRNGTVSTRHLVEDGYETADEEVEVATMHDETIAVELNDQDLEVNDVENIPREVILKRINSKKETKSYQLGKQLSCKWTTGAGPRIGCVRDYPSELQFQALEQVNLSPRSIIGHSSALNRKISTPTGFVEAATTAPGSPMFSKAKLMHGSLSLIRTQSTPTQ